MGAHATVPAKTPPLSLEQRQDPEVRRKMSDPAMRTFFRIADAWKLSVIEQRAILGWPAASTFHKYKSGNVATLPFDMLMRVSLVLGIYTALRVLFPEAELADRWIKLPNSNPLFGGKPALTLMMDGGMDGLYKVRRLLDGRRGAAN